MYILQTCYISAVVCCWCVKPRGSGFNSQRKQNFILPLIVLLDQGRVAGLGLVMVSMADWARVAWAQVVWAGSSGPIRSRWPARLFWAVLRVCQTRVESAGPSRPAGLVPGQLACCWAARQTSGPAVSFCRNSVCGCWSWVGDFRSSKNPNFFFFPINQSIHKHEQIYNQSNRYRVHAS